jgi:hypothetical protein
MVFNAKILVLMRMKKQKHPCLLRKDGLNAMFGHGAFIHISILTIIKQIQGSLYHAIT